MGHRGGLRSSSGNLGARMTISQEKRLAAFVSGFRLDQASDDAVRTTKRILLAVCGTAIAGAREEGVAALRERLKRQGGAEEATVMVYGDRLPAPSAALINGVMGRALDFCDSMAPGLHAGSSFIPAALAAAEMQGGCSGKDFLAALLVGAESASRMNLTEDTYDGFDPTGVAGIFGAASAAARVLGLNEERSAQTLALAFNRCGGSFQSNVDGSLAVRLIQGWVAEAGLNCALFAQAGLTGPTRFLDGIYGYGHLFGRDRVSPKDLLADLGQRFALNNTMFKRYPSCGLTQGVTELMLKILKTAPLKATDVESISIRVPPYAYKLVGGDFEVGLNPRVNAQFSLQYCAASALIRRGSDLDQFRPENVNAPEILELTKRIAIISDAALNARGHTAVDLMIRTRSGNDYSESLDIAPGFPGNPLNDAEHKSRFDMCMRYAKNPLPSAKVEQLASAILDIEKMKDVRDLAQMLVVS